MIPRFTYLLVAAIYHVYHVYHGTIRPIDEFEQSGAAHRSRLMSTRGQVGTFRDCPPASC